MAERSYATAVTWMQSVYTINDALDCTKGSQSTGASRPCSSCPYFVCDVLSVRFIEKAYQTLNRKPYQILSLS